MSEIREWIWEVMVGEGARMGRSYVGKEDIFGRVCTGVL
jgi:hypothetical protein